MYPQISNFTSNKQNNSILQQSPSIIANNNNNNNNNNNYNYNNQGPKTNTRNLNTFNNTNINQSPNSNINQSNNKNLALNMLLKR